MHSLEITEHCIEHAQLMEGTRSVYRFKFLALSLQFLQEVAQSSYALNKNTHTHTHAHTHTRTRTHTRTHARTHTHSKSLHNYTSSTLCREHHAVSICTDVRAGVAWYVLYILKALACARWGL